MPIQAPAALSPSARWALAALSLSMLLASLGTSIANVGLPTLARAFDASFQDVQWIVVAYLLAITTLIVGAGRLGDLIGRRRLLLMGLTLFTGASALCGLAPTLALLITARAAQGLGAAIMLALTMAFVGEIIPKTRTGTAMGLLGTMSAVGTALGPSLGGFLIAGPGWRTIFLINVPLGLLALLLAWRTLPADRTEAPAPAGFDLAGTLLLAGTLAAYALAVTLGHGVFGALNLALLLAAVAGAALFIHVEAKARAPLVRLNLFGDRVLRAGLITSALVSVVMMTTFVVGPFYLSQTLHLDAARVGLVLSIGPLVAALSGVPAGLITSALVSVVMMTTFVVGPFYLSQTLHLDAARVGLVLSIGPLVAALSGVPAGRLTDRFGAERITLFGLVCLTSGCSLLATLPASLGVPGYGAPLVLTTLGYALFQTANNTTVMTDIRPDQRGVISGMLNLSRNLGLVTGASAMGAVFALSAATADITTAAPEAVANGLRVAFAVAAALMLAALLTAWISQARTARAEPEAQPGE